MTHFTVKGTVPEVTPYLISFSVDGEEYCEEPVVVSDLVITDFTVKGKLRLMSLLNLSGSPSMNDVD